MLRVAPVLITAVLLLSGLVPGRASAAALLPDLDQEAPSQLDVSATGSGTTRRFRLGFRSAVRNVGSGPLVIEGRRASLRDRFMRAAQVIERDDARPDDRVPGAGRLRYVRSVGHEHWHYERFESYELRPAGAAGGPVIRDRKSGFCLGDRYAAAGPFAGPPAADPVFTSRCGLRRPDLRFVREGISVGHGDDYAAHVEFQDLPLDDLADGRYVLVHRVDVARRLRQLSRANDAASLLLDLRWSDAGPRLTVLARCPDSARCERPTSSTAAAGRALPLRVVAAAGGLRLVCRLTGGRS